MGLSSTFQFVEIFILIWKKLIYLLGDKSLILVKNLRTEFD
jgi:hypothetical protein